MTSDTERKPLPRRRGKPIEVWVTDEEKAKIIESSETAGMSRSGYLRALGLNTPVRSVVDLKAVAELAKINGDLGRVAGLLKLWLTAAPYTSRKHFNIEELILEFIKLQDEIRQQMGKIVFQKRAQ